MVLKALGDPFGISDFALFPVGEGGREPWASVKHRQLNEVNQPTIASHGVPSQTCTVGLQFGMFRANQHSGVQFSWIYAAHSNQDAAKAPMRHRAIQIQVGMFRGIPKRLVQQRAEWRVPAIEKRRNKLEIGSRHSLCLQGLAHERIHLVR